MKTRADRLYHLSITSAFTMTCLLALELGMGAGAIAQNRIVPDNTLGNENSRLNRETIRGMESDRISGGARRGENLFHSFEQFDVGEELGAYFDNPEAVRNIFSRITGSDPSEILGRLGVIRAGSSDVLGDANLFFINPNGILFGPGASLDVGGSFVATTANGIQFGDQGFFSATNPEVPSQLLTIDPSAYFFNQLPTGNIVVRSTALVRSGSRTPGLQVGNGENLLVLGGDVSIDGSGGQAGLRSLGGRVEIGSVAGLGSVELNPDGSLAFPKGLTRGNVDLRSTLVNVSLDNAGAIAVTADNIRMTESTLRAGIASGQKPLESQAGDLTLNATGEVWIDQSSMLTNQVNVNAIGNGGNIVIQAGSLFVTDDAQLQTSTAGQGNAGDIIIQSSDQVRFVGTGDDQGAFSRVMQNGTGQGGNIEITATTLEVLNGARLRSITRGTGNAGNILIRASDRVRFMGTRTRLSDAFSIVEQDGTGQGGSIEITTPSLDVVNAQLQTGTFGQGDGGDIVIQASNRVRFSSTTGEGQSFSGAFSPIGQRANGQGGTIAITTSILEVLNGARLNVNVRGRGNAGSIIIRASDRVRFVGTGANGELPSAAFGIVEENGTGEGGSIEITTPILEVLDGARLSVSTQGAGEAGSILIRASDRVTVDGVSRRGFSSSAIFTGTLDGARRQGGRVEIIASTVRITNAAVINAATENSRRGGSIVIRGNQLEATNGGQIIATTGRQGQAGNITLDVDQIRLSGSDPTFTQRVANDMRSRVVNEGNGESGLFASARSGSTGRGGRITIDSNTLTLEDGAVISAESNGTGQAGDIQITSTTLQATDSDIRTAAMRSGGDITIQADQIQLQGDSDIRTNSGIDGGNITLQASSILAFDDSDIFAFAGERGGDITLNTNAFFGSGYQSSDAEGDIEMNPEVLDDNDRVDIDASGQVRSGTITTPDTSFIQNSLTDLSENAIDTDTLVANSCVVRSPNGDNTFTIVGAGGLPQRPSDLPRPTYPTGEVRSVAEEPSPETNRPWQIGDPIVEPDGIYHLDDGRVVLSRLCR